MNQKPKFKQRPPHGICIPVELLSVRDTDTQVYRIQNSPYCWAVRLIDVWAPEKRTTDPAYNLAKEGSEWVASLLKSTNEISLFIPDPPREKTTQLLKNLTFDRIPGWVFLGRDRLTLNERIVIAGYASSTKGGPIGT